MDTPTYGDELTAWRGAPFGGRTTGFRCLECNVDVDERGAGPHHPRCSLKPVPVEEPEPELELLRIDGDEVEQLEELPIRMRGEQLVELLRTVGLSETANALRRARTIHGGYIVHADLEVQDVALAQWIERAEWAWRRLAALRKLVVRHHSVGAPRPEWGGRCSICEHATAEEREALLLELEEISPSVMGLPIQLDESIEPGTFELRTEDGSRHSVLFDHDPRGAVDRRAATSSAGSGSCSRAHRSISLETEEEARELYDRVKERMESGDLLGGQRLLLAGAPLEELAGRLARGQRRRSSSTPRSLVLSSPLLEDPPMLAAMIRRELEEHGRVELRLLRDELDLARGLQELDTDAFEEQGRLDQARGEGGDESLSGERSTHSFPERTKSRNRGRFSEGLRKLVRRRSSSEDPLTVAIDLSGGTEEELELDGERVRVRWFDLPEPLESPGGVIGAVVVVDPLRGEQLAALNEAIRRRRAGS